MDFILLLTISSSVLSIIGFFISICKNIKWSISALCIISSVTFICMSIYIQKLEMRINRLENIQCAASKLIDNRYSGFSSEGFVQAALSFLESNKDLYPDTYKRAVDIATGMHASDSIYRGIDAANEIAGIIRGIAILNGQ